MTDSIRIPPGSARQCTRCGALGTHYLTCPVLRLPRDYRLSEDPASAYRSGAGNHASPPAGDSRLELCRGRRLLGRESFIAHRVAFMSVPSGAMISAARSGAFAAAARR